MRHFDQCASLTIDTCNSVKQDVLIDRVRDNKFQPQIAEDYMF